MHILNQPPQSLNSAADGTAAAPSISFLADQDTGIYRIGANNIGIAAGGAKVLDILSGQLTLSGSGADCYISTIPISGNVATFGCDATGQYTYAAAGLGIRFRTNGGTTALTLSSTQAAIFADAIRASDGSLSAPSISFANDPDTGFYSQTSNQIALTFGGQYRGYFSVTGNDFIVRSSVSDAQLTLGSAGNVAIQAAQTNQNITLTPSGTGTVVAPSLTAPASTDLTLAGGSSGGSLVLGQGASGEFTLTSKANATVQTATGTWIYNDTSSTGPQIEMRKSGTAHAWFGTDGAWVGGTGTNFFMAARTNIRFFTNFSGTEHSRLTTTGNLLLGTAGVDSSNGILQLSTNALATTSAYGIGFGTDTSIYRKSAGVLAVGGAIIDLISASAAIRFSGNSVMYGSSGSLILGNTSGTTVLTLDSSQNATFAANVTVSAVLSASSVSGFGISAFSATWANFGVSTAARSSLRLGHGVAPTSPVDGDMWTTTAGLYVRINGATVGPLA